MKVPVKLPLLLLLAIAPILEAQQPLQLSLKQAADAALEPGGNVQVQLAREAVRQAESHAAQVRADLLPDISASVGQQSQTVSLTQYGLQTAKLPNGFDLPNVVGPFNTFDARGKMSQKLVDLSSIRRYQSAQVATDAVREDSETAKENTAAEAARAYLLAVRAQALVETAQANVELSDALLRLATSQKEAGTGTGIEVTRAHVQLANDRQALLAAQAQFSKTSLELLQAIGFDLDARIELTDRLSYESIDVIIDKKAVT